MPKPIYLLNYKLGENDDVGEVQRGIQRLAQYFTGQSKTYRALAWLVRNRELITFPVTADMTPGVGPGYNIRCPDMPSYTYLQEGLKQWANDLQLYGNSTNHRVSVARLLRTIVMPGNLDMLSELLRKQLMPVKQEEAPGDALWEILARHNAPGQQANTKWEI